MRIETERLIITDLTHDMEAHKGARKYVAFADKCWPAFPEQFGFEPCYVNSRLSISVIARLTAAWASIRSFSSYINSPPVILVTWIIAEKACKNGASGCQMICRFERKECTIFSLDFLVDLA